MKRYQIDVNGRIFDVQVLSDPRQEQVQVEVDGVPLIVEVKTPSLREETIVVEAAPAGKTATSLPAGATASNIVAAPLPGVIKSIAVQPGQQVGPGDELLVIEAMKMDNVIRATREGVIDVVHVAEGYRVAHGDPMLEYNE